MSLDAFETELIRMSDSTLISFLRYNNLLASTMFCYKCRSKLLEVTYKKVKDGKAWYCLNKECGEYKIKVSIRKGSFFEGLNLSLMTIIKILIRWSCDQQQHSILKNMEINSRTYKKIILRVLFLVEIYDIKTEKMGGLGKIVQADETGLNFKVKSHRGRAPENKTDALCIIEFDTAITRAFACVIDNKKADTIIPIICDKVEKGSVIYTDEHKSYGSLNEKGFKHSTVCHKREFVNLETGVNTQAVESFNNELCLEIKRRKGVSTKKRPEYLEEFCWKFNNKDKRFLKVWHLIKMHK